MIILDSLLVPTAVEYMVVGILVAGTIVAAAWLIRNKPNRLISK